MNSQKAIGVHWCRTKSHGPWVCFMWVVHLLLLLPSVVSQWISYTTFETCFTWLDIGWNCYECLYSFIYFTCKNELVHRWKCVVNPTLILSKWETEWLKERRKDEKKKVPFWQGPQMQHTENKWRSLEKIKAKSTALEKIGRKDWWRLAVANGRDFAIISPVAPCQTRPG